MPLTASYIAVWRIASARDAIGGGVRFIRMAWSAAVFQSVTTSADAAGAMLTAAMPASIRNRARRFTTLLRSSGHGLVRRGDRDLTIRHLDVAEKGSGGFGEVGTSLAALGPEAHLETGIDDVAVDRIASKRLVGSLPDQRAVVGVELHDLPVHVANVAGRHTGIRELRQLNRLWIWGWGWRWRRRRTAAACWQCADRGEQQDGLANLHRTSSSMSCRRLSAIPERELSV